MKASIEISMYPFDPDYEESILSFVKDLHAHPELKITTNSMSTQVFGDFDILMDVMKNGIKNAFSSTNTTVMVLKIVNQDLS